MLTTAEEQGKTDDGRRAINDCGIMTATRYPEPPEEPIVDLAAELDTDAEGDPEADRIATRRPN